MKSFGEKVTCDYATLYPEAKSINGECMVKVLFTSSLLSDYPRRFLQELEK